MGSGLGVSWRRWPAEGGHGDMGEVCLCPLPVVPDLFHIYLCRRGEKRDRGTPGYVGVCMQEENPQAFGSGKI